MTPKYMMATKAFHQLGEISSNEPDICVVTEETDTDYIGSWVFGLGFFGVKFPKETTRELTQSEIEFYNGKKLSMYSLYSGEKSFDCGQLSIDQ